MDANEQAQVRAILIAARVKRSDLEWMVESCPSVEDARKLYSRTYKAIASARRQSDDYYADVRRAQRRVTEARRNGSEAHLAEAMQALVTEIAIVQDRIEREAQGLTAPELPQSTIDALEALP